MICGAKWFAIQKINAKSKSIADEYIFQEKKKLHFSCLDFKAFWVFLEMHKSISSFFDLGFNSIKLAQGIFKTNLKWTFLFRF